MASLDEIRQGLTDGRRDSALRALEALQEPGNLPHVESVHAQVVARVVESGLVDTKLNYLSARVFLLSPDKTIPALLAECSGDDPMRQAAALLIVLNMVEERGGGVFLNDSIDRQVKTGVAPLVVHPDPEVQMLAEQILDTMRGAI